MLNKPAFPLDLDMPMDLAFTFQSHPFLTPHLLPSCSLPLKKQQAACLQYLTSLSEMLVHSA